MKKIFMIASLVLLSSCGKDTPKCDDKEVIETVLSIVKDNGNYGSIGYYLTDKDYRNPKITNLITTSKDDELKSCNCEGTINLTGTLKKEVADLVNLKPHDYFINSDVSYFVQKNSEGETIVQVNFVGDITEKQ